MFSITDHTVALTVGLISFGMALTASDVQPVKEPASRFEITQLNSSVAPYSDNWIKVIVGVKNNGSPVTTLYIDVHVFDNDGGILDTGGCSVSDLRQLETKYCDATIKRHGGETFIVAVPGPFL